LVVVDDSIVRGTTTRALVTMLREAGAAEAHLRISSPPYRWPCYFGMDTGDRTELLAAHLSGAEMCDYVGADTLAFIDIDGLTEATGAAGGRVLQRLPHRGLSGGGAGGAAWFDRLRARRGSVCR